MIPGIGTTYYSNPGSPTAPQLTWTIKRGWGGGGLHGVYLGNGMTSRDTLGTGATASAGLGVDATVNANVPDIRQSWNMKVTSVEGGLGLPGVAATQTLTPQQIADFTERYLGGPGPKIWAEYVRDSAAAAGVPSRNNEFEYGFPEPSSTPSNVFDTGATSVRQFVIAPENPRGLPGLIAGSAGSDTSSPAQPVVPAGGVLGLIRDYMRTNPNGGATR